MDDPEEEWGMEEYYPCSSGEDESESKVSWLWNRGLKLGKKVVMTGVVISSAPLVLPPLLVASALGFAVSVPFGVVFASYACTEKLMSKLLPMPVSSPFLEYESLLLDETEEESEFGEFLKEVVKEETELRIELEEDGNKEQPDGENGLEEIEVVEGGKRYKDESGKDIGYEEDGKHLEGADRESLGGTDVKTEGSMEEVDKKPMNEESKNEKPAPEVKRVVVLVGEGKKNDNEVTNPGELVVVSRKAKSDIRDVQVLNSNEEHNKLKEGTTGLVEKIWDECLTGESVKKHKKKHKHHHSKKSHGIVGQKEDKHGKNVDEKMNEHTKGDETLPDVKKKSTEEADAGAITKNVVTDDRSSVKSAGDQGTATHGSHAPENHEVKPGTAIQESEVNSIAIDEKQSKSIGSSAARRETDEKGINEKNVGYADNSVQAGSPKPKHDGIKSKEDSAISTNEIPSSEEKIWDQINALRVIVGYKAARQPSCTGELKSLYIFTGVEPPSSFDKSADLRDTEDKLHFLMSIVGVK